MEAAASQFTVGVAPLVHVFVRHWPYLYARESPKTNANNCCRVKPFAKVFGDLAMDEITESMVREFAAKYPGDVRYVRTMFNDAIASGLIAKNPFDGVKAGPRTHVSLAPLSHAEVLELMSLAIQKLGPYGLVFRNMIACSAYIGIRAFELRQLPVLDVTTPEDPKRILVRNGKGARDRECVVPVEARAALACSGRPGDELVYLNRSGKPLGRDIHSLYWKEVLAHFPRHVQWKQLRAFCATWMLEEKRADASAVAWQLHGNANPATLMRYYTKADRSAALDRLEGLVG